MGKDVKRAVWIPGTQTLASCSYDDSIKFWVQSDDDWVCVSTLTGHESTVWCLDFTPDGRYMASCSDDKTVKIWERNEAGSKTLYSLVSTLSGYHDRPVYSVSWNQDGTLLATVREEL
jgi:WD40 repeat protein